jgi:hypothetical protein
MLFVDDGAVLLEQRSPLVLSLMLRLNDRSLHRNSRSPSI